MTPLIKRVVTVRGEYKVSTISVKHCQLNAPWVNNTCFREKLKFTIALHMADMIRRRFIIL